MKHWKVTLPLTGKYKITIIDPTVWSVRLFTFNRIVSFSEARSSSASQVCPRVFWTLRVHNCVHKRPPQVPIVSHKNPVPTLQSYCFQINFNIILPSTPRSSKWPIPFRIFHQNSSCISLPIIHTPRPPLSSPCLDHLNICGWEFKSQSSFLQPPVNSSLLGKKLFLSTLFSYTLSSSSSLHIRDHVSHPYKTTGKIMVLFILTFMFIDGKWELKTLWNNAFDCCHSY